MKSARQASSNMSQSKVAKVRKRIQKKKRFGYFHTRFDKYSISKRGFSRFLRNQIEVEIVRGEKLRFKKEALALLQLESEKIMMQLFACAQVCATHAGRKTVREDDFSLLPTLLGQCLKYDMRFILSIFSQ